MPRIFMIGNGPSLRPSDLTTLHNHGEKCFGVNRCHLMYPKTPWRPDYWCIGDRSRQPYVGKDIDIHLDFGYPCYVRADICKGGESIVWLRDHSDRFIPWIQCDHIDSSRNPPEHWHTDGTLCMYGGSLIVAAQIAILQLGYDELYFIGCDLGYKANANNNFCPEYVDPDSMVVPWNLITNKTMAHAHSMLKTEATKRGVKVFNATRGGELSVHPRVDFDTLWR